MGGKAVTLDENNQFTLPAEGTQKIVATDKAGNSASVTATVNDNHTAGEDDGDCTTAVDTDMKSPDTGDNSHMALWIAILLVSGGLLTVTGICSKKKRSAR